MLDQITPNKIKSLGNFTIRKIFGAFLSTSLPLISAMLDAYQGAWIEPARLSTRRLLRTTKISIYIK